MVLTIPKNAFSCKFSLDKGYLDMDDFFNFSDITEYLRREPEVSDRKLEKMVNAFLALSTGTRAQKLRAGSWMHRLLRASGNRPLERKFLLGFTASDTGAFLKLSADQARHTASFKTYLAMRTRKMKLNGHASCPEWLFWKKDNGVEFASRYGMNFSKIRTQGKLKDVVFEPGTVVKPLDAGNAYGVYLIQDEDNIFDARIRSFFRGYKELQMRLEEDLATKRSGKDEWIVEDLLVDRNAPGKLPRDIKFFVFYGKIEMIQVIERHPEVNEVWLDGNFNPIKPGPVIRGVTPKGWHISEDDMEYIRNLSLSIPTPFLRIDMLAGEDELCFGEFTPRPGIWHQFNRPTDLRLGDAVINAESRLFNDLIAGKKFKLYADFRDSILAKEAEKAKT